MSRPISHPAFFSAILWLLFMATVSVDARTLQSINDGWTFQRPLDSLAIPVHLPHCWNSEDVYDSRDYYRGKGVYKKTLSVSNYLPGKKYFIKLDGAASSSEILINGHNAGSSIGAYSSHTYDITPFIMEHNEESNHTLTVIVDNSRKDIPPYSADFSFMGGLYRDAWLVSAEDVHLDFINGTDEGFDVISKVDKDDVGSLKVSGDIVNDSGKSTQIRVAVTISDSLGYILKKGIKKVFVPSDSSSHFSCELRDLKDLALWTPESPSLYKVNVDIMDGDRILDNTWTYTAFRTFGFDHEGQFLLNGNPYKLRGVCRHQDRRGAGIALSDEEHRRDIKLAKELGGNFIRISHYPQDDAVLDMCDRLGLIVWEEIPVIDYVPDYEGFQDNCEIMLRDMIRRHRNHPSIAMWGYMNEILLRVPGDKKKDTLPRTLDLAHRLEEVLKNEDPDRLSAMAFHGSDMYHDAALTDITDVKGWNLYQGWYGGRLEDFPEFLSRQHHQHPDHRIIVSEYGAGSDRRIHSLNPQPFDFSMEYQQKYLESYLPVIEDSAFVAGASHWNLIDFSSANRAESMPHINNKGILTNAREKKDVFYYFSSMWHNPAIDTVAHIAIDDWRFRKDLTDAGGIAVHPIKVYTNLPRVSMSLGGKPVGMKEVVNCTAVFDVPLHDGRNILTINTPDQPSKLLDAGVIELDAVRVRDGMIDLCDNELAVNVGSQCWYRSDETGVIWIPDREYTVGEALGYVGGEAAASQDEIALTSDQPPLQTCRKNIRQYHFNTVPGLYEIEMRFSELSSPSEMSAYMLGRNAGAGSSSWTRMDIAINGNIVEKDFSPGNDGGVKAMMCRRYSALADDSGITVSFIPRDGATHLSAIKIRKL